MVLFRLFQEEKEKALILLLFGKKQDGRGPRVGYLENKMSEMNYLEVALQLVLFSSFEWSVHVCDHPCVQPWVRGTGKFTGLWQKAGRYKEETNAS